MDTLFFLKSYFNYSNSKLPVLLFENNFLIEVFFENKETMKIVS